MGKDLRGKEIGEGLYQLKSGRYCARVSRFGNRENKTFDSLAEARIWLAKEQTRTEPKVFNDEITLDEWYEYWITTIKEPSVAYGTYIHYVSMYKHHIKDGLGSMKLCDIKPINVQMFLNDIQKTLKPKTICNIMNCLKQLLEEAVDNELIDHVPFSKSIKLKSREVEERRIFTVQEQTDFVRYIKSHNYKYGILYLLILETGLRSGEILGLKWSDIDFKERKIHVNRTMYFNFDLKKYCEKPPKTKAGYRIIPLTDTAYQLLKSMKATRIDYVFLDPDRNTKIGLNPTIYQICDYLGIKKISAHGLRHTFATRCIECGMRPKTLQKIMGHQDLSITMNLYVHVTDDSLFEEMKKLKFIG